jgi:hypothetical protein
LGCKLSTQSPLPAAALQLRTSGPGGVCLLYTTRQHNLHTLPAATLLAQHAQQAQQSQQQRSQPLPQQQATQQPQPQHFLKAMRAAMRPAGNGGAATDVSVRVVEQHALLVAVPPGGSLNWSLLAASLST